jgi:hypothetical protein
MRDLGTVRYMLTKPEHEGSFQADEVARGSFQINLFGISNDYLKLAAAIKEFAETSSANDSEYHEHHYDIPSADGATRLEVILRKDDVGDATWRVIFEPR